MSPKGRKVNLISYLITAEDSNDFQGKYRGILKKFEFFADFVDLPVAGV